MKRTILTMAFLAGACALPAQSTTQNYIRTRMMTNSASTSYVDDIRYYDGMGRPFQNITKSVLMGTLKERLGTLQEYDAAGRTVSGWLPVPVTADYVSASAFKTTAQGNTGYGESYPYSQPVYEDSPLGRTAAQWGAGSAWRTASRSVRTEYLVNTASGVQACKLYSVSGTSLAGGSSYYAAGTLDVVKTTDEDNNVGYTFSDKQGRKLLERSVNGSEYLDTYYVYDAHDNLRFVLQPMYQSEASLEKYAFRYEYDHRNLCVKKTLPGAGYISYTYNEGGQMTFSQDGNQRSSGKYTYYLYDKYGRMTEQGECTGTAYADKSTHIVNHYDDYSFIGTTGFTDALYTSGDTNGKGCLTGQTVTVLGSNDKIYIAHYYDIKGRVTKEVQNNLLGGYDVTTTTYTFTGNPLTVTHTHTATGKTSRTEVYTYTYDYADRLSTVKHKLGSGTEVTLASYTYDNKGRMATKRLHGSSTNTLTYSYNIRSWLTGISSTKFTQTLGYGSHYNGNISSMNWTANGTSHAYTFTYDDVNRMLNATHGTGAYTEKVTSYDKNGNIKALQRYGNGLIDNLTYTYSGNQLTKVEDATGNTAGFNNGASTANEYVYDNNGNLTKDSNKGITNIAYNCLNLPSTVTFSDGSTIVYSYAADGTKLRTVHTISGTTTQKDYCANVVYENGVQKMLLTEEGYVDLSVTTPAYYYYLKDHQGNNRVVINSSGTVSETNHYYPFGGVFASTGNVQPYKYNGKELDTKKGLNWYDYGARHYDATLGRWLAVDPLAEKMYGWSPYAYCYNNPMRYIDPNGQDGWDIIVGYGIGLLTNVLPNTGFLRDAYTPTDVSDYNNALRGMDNASMAMGIGMVSFGGGTMLAGETVTVAGVAVTVGSVGTASAASIPAAVSGVAVTEAGAIMAASGMNMMSNARQNKDAGYDRGKKGEGRSGSTIAKEGEVSIQSYGTGDVHKPAHAHVKGGGKEVRIGPKGHPLKGEPNLSKQQQNIVEKYKNKIRKELNKVGRTNKRLEDENR